MAKLQIWLKDQETAEAAILDGESVEVIESSYARNDFVLDFLHREGLWEIITSMHPTELKKENGKNWYALNGLALVKELMKCSKASGKKGVEKIISDANLVAKCGFSLAAVNKVATGTKSVIVPETLSNHL